MDSTRVSRSQSRSSIYRRVWRWHFYAGLICLPFLSLLALTGALYLYKDPIESIIYSHLFFVEESSSPKLDAQSIVAKALNAQSGEVAKFTAPLDDDRSAEVTVRTRGENVSVFVNPSNGQVLGRLSEDDKLMERIKRTHTLMIVGPVANYWVEVVAGWSIVIVITGLLLGWPKGPEAGLYRVRGRPKQRKWWRGLHAVTGITAAGVILFLAVTGMPWSAFWGRHFSRLTHEWGIGSPRYLWEKPNSLLTATLGATPWALTVAPLPQSDPHAHHLVSESSSSGSETLTASIGLNKALSIFRSLGLPEGVPISLPLGPKGVYSAIHLPDDVRAQRVVHLDRYSGIVRADIRYKDFGIAGKAAGWGVSLHTGRQYGWINRLVMLAGCLSILVLSLSAVVMWWKRRPSGRLAAPPRGAGDRAPLGAIVMVVMLGLLYPLLGASLLIVVALDYLLPRRCRDRFSL